MQFGGNPATTAAGFQAATRRLTPRLRAARQTQSRAARYRSCCCSTHNNLRATSVAPRTAISSQYLATYVVPTAVVATSATPSTRSSITSEVSRCTMWQSKSTSSIWQVLSQGHLCHLQESQSLRCRSQPHRPRRATDYPGTGAQHWER